jgi:small subunit ribosomal protein S4
MIWWPAGWMRQLPYARRIQLVVGALLSLVIMAGDVIEVRESSRSSAKFAKLTGPEAPVVALPSWLDREAGTLKGVVNKLPERSDIDYEVAEHLIVELYSK